MFRVKFWSRQSTCWWSTVAVWAQTWRLRIGVSVGVVDWRVSNEKRANVTHFTMKIIRT